MHVLRRFVWWKCLFWIALGCGCGAAVATLRPEPEAPANATRVPVERFVTILTAAGSSGDAISNLVLYPQHDLVRLLTFDLQQPGKFSKAYAFANTPFLKAQQLQNVVNNGRETARYASRDASAVYAGRLSVAADEAIAAVQARPNHNWATVTDFLDQVHAKHPAFTYTPAWWTQNNWRYGMPMAVGGVVVGIIGSVLTRRSMADVIAADLLRNTRVEQSAAPVPSATQDMTEVEALDAILAAKLAGDPRDDEEAQATDEALAGAPAAIAKLDGGPLVAAPDAAKEDKSYAGEFYPTVRGPTVRGPTPKAFSVVELLVAIGIIGVLMAILLPTVMGARRSANTIGCSSNLRSIGEGMTLYLAQNLSTFPPAYLYIGHKIANGVQTPTSPSAGYIHWSSYLYGAGTVGQKAFQCPSMKLGGLPPTNTPPDNRDPGQNCPSQTVVDEQAPRLAYTVNEVLCPRNKFVAPSFGGTRVYRFVKVTEVANTSGTILGTEMIDNAQAISYDDGTSGWIMSHRPLPPFIGLNGNLDFYTIPVGTGFRPTTAADLDADPNSTGTASQTRLDLVGRNHGSKKGYPDQRLSNFLYVDGHVETKTVYDTVQPTFEWGAKFYSLVPNDDQVSP